MYSLHLNEYIYLNKIQSVLFTQLCPILCNPVDSSPPGSYVHGILQQEYRSGLPFPSPEDLPDPGIELGSPALHTDSLPPELLLF